jgi:maltose alpha-D-glucosyltransferase/alpha-amylase
MSVRAPMQWAAGPNGGFSSAPVGAMRRPVVPGRKLGPAGINVQDQERDPESLLRWIERLIRRRRQTPEIAFGDWRVIDTPEAAVIALRYDWGRCSAIVLHNLADEPVETAFELDKEDRAERLACLLGKGDVSARKGGRVVSELPRYGYQWLRVARDGG